MRKFTAILCATALVSIMPATPALAESQGATITKDGPCGGFVPTEAGEFDAGAFLFGEITLNVANKAGNGTIVCKFDVPEELVPDSIRKSTDFPCGITGIGVATSQRMVVTPSGDATLTCHYNAKQAS